MHSLEQLKYFLCTLLVLLIAAVWWDLDINVRSQVTIPYCSSGGLASQFMLMYLRIVGRN
jgi:hypothetical protein